MLRTLAFDSVRAYAIPRRLPFNNVTCALIMATLPFALAGGFWLLWLLGHNLSIAGGVGFIALAGVSTEFGVIMLLYLKHAWEARLASGRNSEADLQDAIPEGAVLRVRPKAMTVAVIIAGLAPIMLGSVPVRRSCNALRHRLPVG